MTTHKRDPSLGLGAYFATEDYVGLGRRIVILFVDFLVIAGTYFATAYAYILWAGDLDGVYGLFFVMLSWVYLTVLKASRFRKVGYLVTGARIVDLKGQRPSNVRMTFRLMLWLFGPIHFVMDLLWSGVDADHQTLRDRFSGTCVVKSQAKPIGTAEIHLTHYHALGFVLMYPRVVWPNSA